MKSLEQVENVRKANGVRTKKSAQKVQENPRPSCDTGCALDDIPMAISLWVQNWFIDKPRAHASTAVTLMVAPRDVKVSACSWSERKGTHEPWPPQGWVAERACAVENTT